MHKTELLNYCILAWCVTRNHITKPPNTAVCSPHPEQRFTTVLGRRADGSPRAADLQAVHWEVQEGKRRWNVAANSRQSEEGFQQELEQEITVLALTNRRALKCFPGQVYYLVIELPLGPSVAKSEMPAWVLWYWASGSVQTSYQWDGISVSSWNWFPNNSLYIELNLYHKEMWHSEYWK